MEGQKGEQSEAIPIEGVHRGGKEVSNNQDIVLICVVLCVPLCEWVLWLAETWSHDQCAPHKIVPCFMPLFCSLFCVPLLAPPPSN